MNSWCSGNLPDESEVRIWFDAQPGEPQTYDYPGSDPSVELTEVRRLDNDEELSLCRLPDAELESLEIDVWDYLETLSEDTR